MSDEFKTWLLLITHYSSLLIRPVIRELHVNAEIFGFKFANYILKCVTVTACDADRVALNRCLHFGLAVFDKFYDLFSLLLRNALLNLDALSDRPARRGFNFAVSQSF